jgi:hypothetical protein
MSNLVGTGLNQVPTNSMLGGLAYQDPDHASIKDLDLKNLSQINSEIADTAVDIFVYDTSKDSDGGAWRHRTTHTSWYNETLNTATRGSRREFPSVAVIVVETGQVTIYDGDDPDLPMWMVFNGTAGGASHNLLVSTGTFCLSALNGTVFMGALAIYVNFISEYSRGHRSTGGAAYWNGPYNGNIAERNSGKGSTQLSDKLILGGSVDAAMTVLPNAPIDSATGLPVPTIAVATSGGVSIIKDDGTVADLSGFSPVTTVHIDENNVIGTSNSGTPSHDFIYKTHIPSGDETYSAGIIAGSKNYYMNSNSGTIPLLRDIDMSDSSYDSKDDVVYRGGNAGFDIIMAGVNYSTTHSNPAIAYISKDYNTGYMAGDIKGAFLSDISTTNASELVTNGTFNSDASGWNSGQPSHVTVSQSGGVLQVVISSGNDGSRYAYQQINNVPAGTYRVTATAVSNPSNRAILRVGTSDQAGSGGGNATNIFNSGYLSGSNATSTHLFTTTETSNIVISLFNDLVSGTGTWDNVKLHLAEEDRSVGNNPLQVFGTITKSAVATGADLVGYGGFSSSNYLIQPYNADLAPGTSEYSVICWVKTGTSTDDQYIFDRTGDNSPRNLILIRASTQSNPNRIQFYHNNAGSNNSDVIATDLTVTDNVWHQVIGLYDGSAYRVYVDGVASAVTNSTVRNVDNTDNPTLYVGVRNSLTAPITGQLALFRYSLSAPSPEQIKKMYEDEKFLFQENAKATLYGSSDAVTALGYDDDTNLLHVGTSSGRSDFRGLRRINNTTTAVTTAISASKEFVAEQ